MNSWFNKALSFAQKKASFGQAPSGSRPIHLVYQPPVRNILPPNKPTTNHQLTIFFSQNKLASVTSQTNILSSSDFYVVTKSEDLKNWLLRPLRHLREGRMGGRKVTLSLHSVRPNGASRVAKRTAKWHLVENDDGYMVCINQCAEPIGEREGRRSRCVVRGSNAAIQEKETSEFLMYFKQQVMVATTVSISIWCWGPTMQNTLRVM
jgi:hypothetical protein